MYGLVRKLAHGNTLMSAYRVTSERGECRLGVLVDNTILNVDTADLDEVAVISTSVSDELSH
jgi:hypothetical protein